MVRLIDMLCNLETSYVWFAVNKVLCTCKNIINTFKLSRSYMNASVIHIY